MMEKIPGAQANGNQDMPGGFYAVGVDSRTAAKYHAERE